MAHLVFSDTRANAQKTKRAIFLQTHEQTIIQTFYILKNEIFENKN